MKTDRKIKLWEIEPTSEGVRRFQSQLLVGKLSADFIIDKDGVLKVWGTGNKSFNFYPYPGPYEIVKNIKQMYYQEL